MYWLNITFARGAVFVDDSGVIIDSSPIYKKFRNRDILNVIEELRKKNLFLHLKFCSEENL